MLPKKTPTIMNWQTTLQCNIWYSGPQSTKGKYTNGDRGIVPDESCISDVIHRWWMSRWDARWNVHLARWRSHKHIWTQEQMVGEIQRNWKIRTDQKDRFFHWVLSHCVHDRNNDLHISWTYDLSLFATFFIRSCNSISNTFILLGFCVYCDVYTKVLKLSTICTLVNADII